MAKAKKESAAGETPLARFYVKHPRGDFSGTLCGIEFRDGAGMTDNATLAHAILSEGCQVLDNSTGQPAFESGSKDAQARIAAHARKWKPAL